MKSLTVPARLDSLEVIANFLTAETATAGLDPQAGYKLRLAADEIATNIIVHGYAGAAQPGTIDIRVDSDERGVTVIVEDSAAPFDPRLVPPPDDLHLPPTQRRLGGLGIYLAMRSVDRFEYERVGDRNRNVLAMDR